MKNPQPLRAEQIDSAFVTDLASVLDSVHKLFEDDAPSSMEGMYDAHRQLQACMAEKDPNLAFERAHQIIKKGLNKWVWNLRKIAGGIVTNLAEIALANPKWVTEDPASWAHSRTKEFLDEWLDGGGSWARTKEFLDERWGSAACSRIKELTPRILIWFRQACDGRDLDFDRYESGRPEPWCAPTWVGQSRDWTNDPAKLDERSTPELTEKLLRTKRRIFNSSLDYGLEKAEHAARINLAKKPAPPPSNQTWPQHDEPTIPANGRKPRVGSRRKLFVLPRLEAKGWSLLDWAVQAGVDPHTASSYLNGKRNTYVSSLKKLADALGVGVDQL
jgi:lambda repressor-like predicted transcriptional regulator